MVFDVEYYIEGSLFHYSPELLCGQGIFLGLIRIHRNNTGALLKKQFAVDIIYHGKVCGL